MKTKLRQSIIFYIISLVIFTIPAVFIRTYQLIAYTDFKTGFYYGPDYLNYLFFGLILAFAFIITIFLCIDSTKYKVKLFLSKCYVLKVFSIITAVFSIIYSFMYIFNLFGYEQKNDVMIFLVFLSGILSAIGFTYFSVRIQKIKGGYADILLVFPCLWSCVQLINMFLEHMIMSSIQENMINILRITTLSVFLLCMGKTIGRLEGKFTQKIMVFAGFTSVLISFCSTLPELNLLIIGFITKISYTKYYSYDNVAGAIPLDFVLSIFVLIFLIQYFINRENDINYKNMSNKSRDC